MFLVTTKFRDGTWPPRLSYRLRRDIDLSSDGVEFSSAAIEEETVFRTEDLPIPSRVFSVIEQNPGCSASMLRERVEGSNSKIDTAACELLTVGAITDRPSGNGHQYSATPGWSVSRTGEMAHLGPCEQPDRGRLVGCIGGRWGQPMRPAADVRGLHVLAEEWRGHATTPRGYGADAHATALSKCAEALEKALTSHDVRSLTLAEASALSPSPLQ